MSDPSEHLVEQARAGDRAAAVELVGLHYEHVFAYFRRLCGSDADAADLTQKTFAKVWVALPSFQGRARFATWIHGIAHHVLADWWRRKDPLESASDEWWEARAADSPSPFEDAAERELAARLYALVGQLDAEKREAVHLHYFQGLTLAETADALGVAASTVKYRLREALEFLRARMTESELKANAR
ncbi:MAG: RNA polymerase sigma factor [Verrucomicrobia bacterium]|nr:RNA polymerase sigma factor [Verrucomicrobiota bacterium]